MSTKRIYKTGETINGVLFIKEIDDPKYRRGLFECPYCKNKFESRIEHIKTGASRSCGCRMHGMLPKHNQTNNKGYRSGSYRTWTCMMARCYGNDPSKQEIYRDKKIIVCERWQDFNNFLADMGERPKGKTLDRFPDNQGNYEPGNARWATPKEQARNTTWNLIVTYNGVTKTLQEWCEELGLEYNRMRNRIFLTDIPAEVAFTEPKRSAKICQMTKDFRKNKAG